MMYSLLRQFDKRVPFATVSAHCDIPCKIYDPITAQVAALSVIRLTDLLLELDTGTPLSLNQQAQLSRLVREKEIHAEKVKAEVRVIWGDYFKAAQFDVFEDTHALVHNIMLAGSACKQHIDRQKCESLLQLVNQFAGYFWQSKGVATKTATCPYPPSMPVLYPDL